MTGLSVVLMITGALLLVAEAHVVSYGVLGVAGVLALVAGILAGAEGGMGAILGNLVPVTLGNIAGGAGGVALAYRLAYSAHRP